MSHWIFQALLFLATCSAIQGQVSGAIDIWPRNGKVEIGSKRPFGAYVPISPNTITWLVNDIPGGNEWVGTISASGTYTPPSQPPQNNVVTIKAESVPYPSSFASTPLTITRPYPWLWSVYPSTIQTGPYSISFNGNNFSPDSIAQANGVDIQTTFHSKTKLVVVGTAYTAGSIHFTVRQPNPGEVTGNAVSAMVQPAVVTVSATPSGLTVDLGNSALFNATVTGSGNTQVVWTVNGGNANGTISASGLYTAPSAMPASQSATVRATSIANPLAYGEVSIALAQPPEVIIPESTDSLSAGRFLEQSSFGPTPESLERVQNFGIDAYLEDQFAMPPTSIPVPSDNSMHTLRRWVLYNYSTAPDQLRQRVVYSLGQITVVSGNKLIYADEILPWMNILTEQAFGNYRDLLKALSMSPSMGKYLDLANSTKPGYGGGANENYARELMQLFTIGLWQLNNDGSQTLDSAGNPISTYDQNTVTEVALALTGWTYATAPGTVPRDTNWEYFGAPMEVRPGNHDPSEKNFLGCTLAAGQTVEQDLDAVIDCLMNHPNTAPFIATRLIRSLVKSNPSPSYIEAVSDVFHDNGFGVNGDLKAVIRAILTHEEARQDDAVADSGRLKEPILHIVGLIRALNGQFTENHQLAYLFDYMAQSPLSPPSVFSWFSPLYRIPQSDLFGPEFQIYTPMEATLRGNLIYHMLHSPGGDIVLDLAPFQPFGNNMPALVESVNQRLLYGRMPEGMKQILIDAAVPGYDAKTRIETVLYLTALSGQCAVQY